VTSWPLPLRSLVLLVLAKVNAATTKLPAKANEVIHPRLVRTCITSEQRSVNSIEPLTAMQTVTRFERELEPTRR